VLLINCDRFKRINDVLGREVGDQVLTLMAERLRSVQRSQDRGGRRRRSRFDDGAERRR